MRKKFLDTYELPSSAELAEEWKWLRFFIRRYKSFIAVYFLLGLASIGLTLGGSVLSKYLIDIVTGQHRSSLLPMAVTYVVFGLVNILSSSVSSRISTKYSTRVTNEIQYEMFRETLDAEWSGIKKFHTGDLIGRVSTDVSAVSDSILTWIPNFVVKIMQSVGCIVIIFYYDPMMALFSVISTPVMVLLSKSLMAKMRLFSKKSREANSRILSFIQESYSNIQSIKAFGIARDFHLRFKLLQNDFYDVIMQQNKFSVLTKILMSVLGMLVSYSCFGWGIYRLWSGVITFGTLQMFLQLAGYLSGSFSALVSMVPSGINALTATRRLIDITSMEKEAQDENVDTDQIKKEASDGVQIRIENADFAYEDAALIFNHMAFQANPGEVTALIGPSGSGKTTLFRILLGLVNVSGGKCEIAYQTEKNEKSFPISPSTRGLFAYVPQGNAVFYGTVAENLRLFHLNASDEELADALKAACAWEFVSRLENGIHTVLDEGGGNLSEGQKQRLCIARALVSTAPVVLLDEGTSALDPGTERQLLQNLSAYRHKKTVIVSTHRMSVLDICDKTYSIEDMGLAALKK